MWKIIKLYGEILKFIKTLTSKKKINKYYNIKTKIKKITKFYLNKYIEKITKINKKKNKFW